MTTAGKTLTDAYQFLLEGPAVITLETGKVAELHSAGSPPAAEAPGHRLVRGTDRETFIYDKGDNIYAKRGSSNEPVTVAYTPINITSPLIYSPNWWGDISNYSSLTFNGSDVSQFDDLSGNGNHFIQNTAANQAFYQINAQNGLPALKFNGTSDWYQCAQEFITTPSDTYVFIYQADDDGDDEAHLFTDYEAAFTRRIAIATDKDSATEIFWVRDGNGNILNVTELVVETFSLLVLTRTPGTPGQITLDYNDLTDIDIGTHLPTTFVGLGTPVIGAASDVSGSGVVPNTFLKGHFCEGMRFPEVLSQFRINKLKDYAKLKWGL